MSETDQTTQEAVAFLQTEKGTQLTATMIGHLDGMRKEMEPSMAPEAFYQLIGHLLSNAEFTAESGSEELGDAQLDNVAGGGGRDRYGFSGYRSPVSVGGFRSLGGDFRGGPGAVLDIRTSKVNT